MRKFNVNVNGKFYEVEVEEVGAVQGQTNVVPVAASKQEVKVAPAPKAPVGKGTPIVVQTPGLIKKLNFANGATVKAEDTVIVLEAMKMDLPIKAGVAGVVNYSVAEGANVDTGTVVCTIA